MIVLFLLPALLLYSVFVLYPIVQSARYSIYDWNGLEPLTDFVGSTTSGGRAGRHLPHRPHQQPLIVALSLLVQIPFALLLANLLDRSCTAGR